MSRRAYVCIAALLCPVVVTAAVELAGVVAPTPRVEAQPALRSGPVAEAIDEALATQRTILELQAVLPRGVAWDTMHHADTTERR